MAPLGYLFTATVLG